MNLIDLLSARYGPLAFGLVAVLVLWRLIVAPELQRGREASKAASEALTTHDATMLTLSNNLTTSTQSALQAASILASAIEVARDTAKIYAAAAVHGAAP